MRTIPRPRRSVLYMPGSNERALEKAKTLPADCLILDLEDAVAPDAKEMAREQIKIAATGGGYGEREIVIRVNGADTEWHGQDVEAAIAGNPDAILLPKVNDGRDIEAFAASLGDADVEIWAMMETPLAMLNAGAIAAARISVPNFTCFVMGTNDLAKETRASLSQDRLAMIPWLMTCVAAARAHGLDIIDGVYNDFRNEPGLRQEAEQGRLFGMDGKTLIHPGQIAACNEIFSPSAEEVENARLIIEAFEQPENQGKGAISLNGRMVELLHRDIAQRTLGIAAAISEREAAA